MINDEAEGLGTTLQDVLRAYADAVMLVEPLQLQLWQSAGVTLTQLRILRVLAEHPCSASELARLAELSPPSLTRVLDRLVEAGYAERLADQSDRRRIAVRILPSGRRLLADHQIWRGSAFAAAAEALTPAQRAHFIDAVRRFTAAVRSAQAQSPAAPPPGGDRS